LKTNHLSTLQWFWVGWLQIRSLDELGSPKKNNIRHSVARCYILKPKIQIWVNFSKPINEKCLEFITDV
jgi:hypothetical protein